MSLDHLDNSRQTDEAELHSLEEKKNVYDEQINQMYNEKKYINPHDIAGQEGIVSAQGDEVNKKKVQFRMANELYLRKHPELNTIISVFLFRVLEEKPDNVLAYAGSFFDQPNLKKVIEIQKEHYLDHTGVNVNNEKKN